MLSTKCKNKFNLPVSVDKVVDMIVRVAVRGPFLQGLCYQIKPTVSENLIGTRVLVPLAKQKVVGVIIAINENSDFPKHKLKSVLAQIDQIELFDKTLLKLLTWISQYYRASIGDVIQMAMPNLLAKGRALEIDQQTLWQTTELGQNINPKQQLKRSNAQEQCLSLIQQSLLPLEQSELALLKVKTQTLNSLANKGYIECSHQAIAPKVTHISSQALILNKEQQQAVNIGFKNLDQFRVQLLQGVTGSGKTEVYLQIIAKVLDQGQQALVLVPEIGLTPQTLNRFRQRFAVPIMTIHSGLSAKEKHQHWAYAHSNLAKIIIGTRSAIFTPIPNLGIIIVDEEHDLSFKQHSHIRYHARDTAIMRALYCNIPIILGSATPSLESLHNAQQKRYQISLLPKRAGAATDPRYHIIDMRQQPLKAGVSQPMLTAIEQHLSANGQVILFLNRRGFAPVLLCHNCGWSAKCDQCDTHYTLHSNPPHLCCHHCGRSQKIIEQCQHCYAPDLQAIGTGTEKLEQALTEQFSDKKILRLDRDITQKKGHMEAALEQIHQSKVDIIIGTQMLAKGHHFENVTMVGIVDLDGALFSQDFRAIEHMGQLLLQVAGRAGRSTRQGEVYLQTHQPEHPSLQTLLARGFDQFTQDLLDQRASSQLPPYSHMSLFRAEAKQQKNALDFLDQIKQSALAVQNEHTEVMGPVPAVMSKRAGYYRMQLLLQSNKRANLHQVIDTCLKTIDKKLARKVRWSIDVDPQEISS